MDKMLINLNNKKDECASDKTAKYLKYRLYFEYTVDEKFKNNINEYISLNLSKIGSSEIMKIKQKSCQYLLRCISIMNKIRLLSHILEQN
jgi:hypothetical protein